MKGPTAEAPEKITLSELEWWDLFPGQQAAIATLGRYVQMERIQIKIDDNPADDNNRWMSCPQILLEGIPIGQLAERIGKLLGVKSVDVTRYV